MKSKTYRQAFSDIKEARQWAYRELDTSKGVYFLVYEETIQGYTDYYFLNEDEYGRHTALWENDLDIVEVWE